MKASATSFRSSYYPIPKYYLHLPNIVSISFLVLFEVQIIKSYFEIQFSQKDSAVICALLTFHLLKVEL